MTETAKTETTEAKPAAKPVEAKKAPAKKAPAKKKVAKKTAAKKKVAKKAPAKKKTAAKKAPVKKAPVKVATKRTIPRYSDEYKAELVDRMVEGESANSISKETGISQPALSRWLRDATGMVSARGRRRKKTVIQKTVAPAAVEVPAPVELPPPAAKTEGDVIPIVLLRRKDLEGDQQLVSKLFAAFGG